MIDRPRLRPVEAFPVQQDGKVLIYLKDPMNLAAPIGIAPVGYFILSHFDGQHSLVDIQEAYCRQFGTVLTTDELNHFIEMLDEHYYLLSERFQNHQQAVVEEFRKLPSRAPAHVGGVYKNNPAELKTQLDGYFAPPKGPDLPHGKTRRPSPKAIVAPHIDFHRGGPAYAWAYRPLADAAELPELVIVFGTDHNGIDHPFTLTRKHYDTPLGAIETDTALVDALTDGVKNRLGQSAAEHLFADEHHHRAEHSIEF